jgi:hypothetical protein
MEAKSKKIDSFIKRALLMGTVSLDLVDHGNDPYFINKNEIAKKNVDRAGIPEFFLKKK